MSSTSAVARVRRGSVGPVRGAVPAAVVGDHAPVSGVEVRDLALPLARVDDRRGRQQDDRSGRPSRTPRRRCARRREPRRARRVRQRGRRRRRWRAAGPCLTPSSRSSRQRRHELADQQVDAHGIAAFEDVAAALDELAGVRPGSPLARPVALRHVADPLVRALDHQRRRADRRRTSRVTVAQVELRGVRCVAASVSASVSRPQPTPSSICFVECGSGNASAKKCSR